MAGFVLLLGDAVVFPGLMMCWIRVDIAAAHRRAAPITDAGDMRRSKTVAGTHAILLIDPRHFDIDARRAKREGRSVPFSELENFTDEHELSVNPERFNPDDHPKWVHHWAMRPRNWGEIPEERLLANETLAIARQAIERLPANQREVIQLRDVNGLSAQEVCNVLGISESLKECFYIAPDRKCAGRWSAISMVSDADGRTKRDGM